MAADRNLSQEDYEAFQGFLEKTCGIVLGDKKHYLVTSRLIGLLDEFKLGSVSELVRRLRTDATSGLRERVIEAMTTNETFWFRDGFPFDIYKNQILPELAAKGGAGIRIWCAASSSGQEPYSLSMATQEYITSQPGSLRGSVQILGTDISPAVLKEAKEARYDSLAMARGLSPERKQRFFTALPSGHYEVKPEIRQRVSFRPLNLLQSYSLMGKHDIIFCRNVLIYFSLDLKRDIVERLSQALNPGGFLFLGASESMAGLSSNFEMIRCNPGVMYRKR